MLLNKFFSLKIFLPLHGVFLPQGSDEEPKFSARLIRASLSFYSSWDSSWTEFHLLSRYPDLSFSYLFLSITSLLMFLVVDAKQGIEQAQI